ncbi:hypothetical protein EVAR_52559_1 [Eumeta japonica]|uniref:Uncharacterized protein n=1 Tax=Eumeta variegata TaxID=151549 RepID=A0A4C1ZRB8_EUMVA|nr:hypothetical protein EVAR_52559_1 [Eumeta japonica]
MRRVALNVRCIETLQISIGSPPSPPENRASRRRTAPKTKQSQAGERCRSYLRRPTPILNNIPDNIETTDDRLRHRRTYKSHRNSEDSSREVPAADSRKLPEDVRVLLKAKTQPCVARAHIRHAKIGPCELSNVK